MDPAYLQNIQALSQLRDVYQEGLNSAKAEIEKAGGLLAAAGAERFIMGPNTAMPEA